MSLLFEEKDIARIQNGASQVIKDAIGQVAQVLVPAIESALKNSLGGVQATITIGPIKIDPIEITIGTAASTGS